MTVPSRQADEALDRLERDISFLESVIRSDEGYTETVIAQCIDAREDIATVRSELGRLRGEVAEWRTSIATEKLTWRAEAAEERARRLEDGLREIEDAALNAAHLLPMTLSTSVEADHRDDHASWAGWLLRHKVLPKARALLSASLSGGGGAK